MLLNIWCLLIFIYQFTTLNEYTSTVLVKRQDISERQRGSQDILQAWLERLICLKNGLAP